MAGEPDDESHDDEDEGSLDVESEEDESHDLDAEDAEKLEHRRKAREYDALQRSLKYDAQQKRNKDDWDGVEEGLRCPSETSPRITDNESPPGRNAPRRTTCARVDSARTRSSAS